MVLVVSCSHLGVSEKENIPQAAHESNLITALCMPNSGYLAQTASEFSFSRDLLSPLLLSLGGTPNPNIKQNNWEWVLMPLSQLSRPFEILPP